jgi:hypothetical protein
MEEEECIICLETIDREIGDYRIELCDKCKYIIHIKCWEDYIKYRGNSYCVVCNKLLHDDNLFHIVNTITPVHNIIVVNNRRNLKKNICCVIFLVILCISFYIIIKTI